MRLWLFLVVILILAAGPCLSAEQQVIKDTMDEYNYSLGYQVGREVLKYQLEFRDQALWQGVYDAVNNAEPFMTEEQIDLSLQQLLTPAVPAAASQTQPPQTNKADASQPKKAYRQRGEAYIAEISTKEGIKSLPGGAKYRVIKDGEGPHPKVSDSVMVNYKAYDIDGIVFDSTSRLGAPIPVEFKISKLLPGLIEALPKMKIGSVWEIILPARMAYKDVGPMAGQTVIYEMELVDILPEFH